MSGRHVFGRRMTRWTLREALGADITRPPPGQWGVNLAYENAFENNRVNNKTRQEGNNFGAGLEVGHLVYGCPREWMGRRAYQGRDSLPPKFRPI